MLDVTQEKKRVCELFSKLEGHGIVLFAKTKNIDEQIFKDKDVMIRYLSIKGLDNSIYLAMGMKNALPSYSVEDLIEFIKINKEVYKVLPHSMKFNWELILPFFEQTKEFSDHIPVDLTTMIKSMGKTFNECMDGIKKCALADNLNRSLGENKKSNTRKMKI